MNDDAISPTPNIVTWPTDDEARGAFEEYCMAVGKVCHAWNYFHEKLGMLYARFSSLDAQAARNVWYSKFQDRWQRKALREKVDTVSNWPNATARDDVIWLLDHADALARDRNDAIHAPCCLYIGGKDGGRSVMGPAFFNGHPRVENLRGKKILSEFDWCEKYTEWLTRFTMQVEKAFSKQCPWPQRPALPPSLGRPYDTRRT
ncbi:MAG: hypothetical protein ACT4O2_00985 [Beijerinckiaceae bacterium]